MYTLTEEQIKALKAKHGKVYLITVEDKQAVFRQPTRQDLSYATAASAQGKDPYKMADVVLQNTYLEGDREIIENDEYFFGAMPVAMQMIEIKQGELKKL